jgi:Secretion system C-terminal sorting domain
MKKILSTLCCCLTITYIVAQQIADTNFARAVKEFCPTCLDSGNKITEEGQKLTSLTISIQNIEDLTGIIGFTSLTSLNCGNNKITFIPPLPSGLKTLFISDNKLNNLNNLPTNLTALYCMSNKLKILPELPQNLQILNCSYNEISFLPKIPSQLNTLICTHNLLTTLPILPITLEALVCANNNIKNLPQLPKIMTLLSCQNNQELTCLPKLPDSLSYLYISKSINCLPNKVAKAIIENYEGIISKQVNLPICTKAQLAFCPPVLQDPTELDKRITFYPNPTDGVINIIHRGSTIMGVTIFNGFGQIIKESNTDILDLTSFAAGWYLIRIETNEETVLKKVIKQ